MHIIRACPHLAHIKSLNGLGIKLRGRLTDISWRVPVWISLVAPGRGLVVLTSQRMTGLALASPERARLHKCSIAGTGRAEHADTKIICFSGEAVMFWGIFKRCTDVRGAVGRILAQSSLAEKVGRPESPHSKTAADVRRTQKCHSEATCLFRFTR